MLHRTSANHLQGCNCSTELRRTTYRGVIASPDSGEPLTGVQLLRQTSVNLLQGCNCSTRLRRTSCRGATASIDFLSSGFRPPINTKAKEPYISAANLGCAYVWYFCYTWQCLCSPTLPALRLIQTKRPDRFRKPVRPIFSERNFLLNLLFNPLASIGSGRRRYLLYRISAKLL